MMKTNPFVNVGPGDLIREELDAREWTVPELAKKLELSPELVTRILTHQQPMTEPIAKRLSVVFRQSAQFWLNQEDLYRAYHRRRDHQLQRLKRAVRAKLWDTRTNGSCRITPGQTLRRVGFRITVAVNLSQWYLNPRFHVGYGVNFCHWLCGRCWWNWEWRTVEDKGRIEP